MLGKTIQPCFQKVKTCFNLAKHSILTAKNKKMEEDKLYRNEVY